MVTPRPPRALALAQVTKERARLASLQANAVELRTARQRGALIDAEAVQRVWSDVLRMARAGCLTISSRAAQQISRLNAHDIAVMDGEARTVVAEIGSDCHGSDY